MTKQSGTAARGGGLGAYPEEFRAWVARRCMAAPEPVINVRPMRTSSGNVTKWEASAITTFAGPDRQDPDVAEAIRLGYDVVRRDAIGETKRMELGDQIFVLRMCHAPGGGTQKRQIGIALHVGRTIFIYLLASARANNLDGITEDRRGNAATEIIAMTVRGVATVGLRRDKSHRTHVRAREHARIIRDEKHGADLKATFQKYRVIAHTPHMTDLSRPGDAQAFSFGSMMSAAQAEAAVQGMSRADVVIQANGGYNGGIRLIPFTHGALVRHEVDIATGTVVVTSDRHRLAPVEGIAKARGDLRRLADKILEDRWGGTRAKPATDWVAVGNLMADMGMHSRKPAHLKNGRVVPLSTLSAKARGRAARRLFSPRWVSGWRNGYFEKLVVPKAAMELDLSNLAHVTEELTDDGRIAYRCRILMPVPEGGWGVTPEEWDEVLARRNPLADRDRVYTGDVLPFAGMPEWDDASDANPATLQFDLATTTSGYLVRSRPITEATHFDGTHRGWEDCTITRAGTARGSELHQNVGATIADTLLSLELATAPIPLTPVRPLTPCVDPVDPVDRETRRAELTAALEDAEDTREGAVDERNKAKGKHRREKTPKTAKALAYAESDLVRATEAVEKAEEVLEAFDAEPDQPQNPASGPAQAAEAIEVGVETAKPEYIAAALEKCTGSAPGWLQEAVRQLLTNFQMKPFQEPGSPRMLRWTATLNLHVVDSDGNRERASIPLAGTVRDYAKARNGNALSHGPEAWAWAFFYRGEDFATIGATAGIDGSGKKNSYLYKGLGEWLTLGDPVPVPNTHMRTAALDCPIPETRRVLWSAVTGDTSALTGIGAGFIQHIRDTYSSTQLNPRWAWCKDTHTLARAAATIMLQRGGSANIYELAHALNVPHTKLLNLALVNGKPIKGTTATNPAATAVSPFTKNWSRGGGCRPAEDRELSLRPCPHADCPERLRGGAPFASHVLVVPETEGGHGVLCPDCRRLPVPSMAHVRFPANYLRPWRGRYGYGSHAGARDHKFSHIDPALTDPGPSAALPDTGTQSRPETMVSKPGNYAAKRLQNEPMAGQRLLPHGLTEKDHSAVAAEVERLGGRVAAKVTKTLSYIVVADRRAANTSEIAARAASLGAKVLTLAQFKTQAERNWPLPDEPAA
jgi:hypothetical protein